MGEPMMMVSSTALTDMLNDLLRELDSLRNERNRYRTALQEIANEDYRGNRPWSAVHAYEALHPVR